MKKLLLSFILLAPICIGAQAQTTQGSLMLGGGISFSSSKNEGSEGDYKTTSFAFIPSVGYFVVDNLAVGANLSLQSDKTTGGINGNYEAKQTSLAVGPFARYYIFTSNEKFAFMAEAGLLFGSGKQESNNNNSTTKSSSVNFYVSPGFTYFLTDKWGVELQLEGLTYSSYDPNKDIENDKRSGFGLGVDFFNPSLGIRYFIGK
jgi:outer membrane protein W